MSCFPDRPRILIVEDDRLGLEALARLLESHGYAVSRALDAAAALRSLEQDRPYTAVLIDLQLPDQDGREVAQRVREKTGAATLVMLMTGFYEEMNQAELARWGIDHMLPKPLPVNELIQILASASTRHPSGTSGTGSQAPSE